MGFKLQAHLHQQHTRVCDHCCQQTTEATYYIVSHNSTDIYLRIVYRTASVRQCTFSFASFGDTWPSLRDQTFQAKNKSLKQTNPVRPRLGRVHVVCRISGSMYNIGVFIAGEKMAFFFAAKEVRKRGFPSEFYPLMIATVVPGRDQFLTIQTWLNPFRTAVSFWGQ